MSEITGKRVHRSSTEVGATYIGNSAEDNVQGIEKVQLFNTKKQVMDKIAEYKEKARYNKRALDGTKKEIGEKIYKERLERIEEFEARALSYIAFKKGLKKYTDSSDIRVIDATKKFYG